MDNNQIIILTHPLSNNYGCLMQAYALQVILRDKGYRVVTDKNACRMKDNASWPRLCFRYFHKLFLKITGHIEDSAKNRETISVNTEKFIKNNINTICFFEKNHINPKIDINDYSTYVVGSDQVWRKGMMNIDPYFLTFINNTHIKKIAYAASFGVDNINDWSISEKKIYSRMLSMFNGISVREDSGALICKDELGVDATHVLDPVMLLQKDDYIKLIDTLDTSFENSLYCYILDLDANKELIIANISQNKNLKPSYIMPKKKIGDKWDHIDDCVFPSVSSWLSGFRDANYIITDSFHGMVFSLVFNKQFVVIANKKRGLSRFTSLLKLVGLEDRLVFSIDDAISSCQNVIDYDRVNPILEIWRNKSISFINENLDNH